MGRLCKIAPLYAVPVIAFVLAMLVSVSCVSNREYTDLRAEYDSIAILNAVLQEEAYVTDSLVATVISSFQELNHAENMINVNTLRGKLPLGEQARIRKNINILSDRLEASNNAIELLIKRIESNNNNSQHMGSTISLLRTQLEQQKERVETIAEETLKKVKEIDNLGASVARLRGEAARLKDFSLGEMERLRIKEDSLNVVYYAMGTKDDLEAMKLLKNDRVSVDNAELSYLTKTDKRQIKEVNMMSKKARLWSIHPRASYTLRPDAKGYLTLVITNPQAFWEYSQIMLAEVDF